MRGKICLRIKDSVKAELILEKHKTDREAEKCSPVDTQLSCKCSPRFQLPFEVDSNIRRLLSLLMFLYYPD